MADEENREGHRGVAAKFKLEQREHRWQDATSRSRHREVHNGTHRGHYCTWGSRSLLTAVQHVLMRTASPCDSSSTGVVNKIRHDRTGRTSVMQHFQLRPVKSLELSTCNLDKRIDSKYTGVIVR